MKELLELLDYCDKFAARELGNKKDDYTDLKRKADAVRNLIEIERCTDGPPS